MKKLTKREIGGRKRYRGQTQTQYIAFNEGAGKERTGTAEAVSSIDSSRATVSKLNITFQTTVDTIECQLDTNYLFISTLNKSDLIILKHHMS